MKVAWDAVSYMSFLEFRRRRGAKTHLVGIDGRALPYKIRLVFPDEFGALEQLPANVQAWIEKDQDVGCEEARHAECGPETAVSEADDHHRFEGEREPCAVRLEPSGVRKRLPVKTLCFAGVVEAEVRDADDDVVDDT